MHLHRSLKALPLCLLLATACTERTLASRFIKTQMVSASAGGTLTVTAADSLEYAGTKITVPPGALSVDTLITVAPPSFTVLQTGTPAGPLVEFGPMGVRFSHGITISVPYQLPASAQASELQISGASPSGTGSIFTPESITFDAAGLTASVLVGEFGDFGAYIPVAATLSCQQSCSTSCDAPGTTCYTDNNDYCNACVAACNNQYPTVCASGCTLISGSVIYDDGGTGIVTGTACQVDPIDGGVGDSCLDKCTLGCEAPGLTCYSDGNDYCTPCVARCSGAQQVGCGPSDANGKVSVTYGIVDPETPDGDCGTWEIGIGPGESDTETTVNIGSHAGLNTVVLPCVDQGGGTVYTANGYSAEEVDCGTGEAPASGVTSGGMGGDTFVCRAGTTASVDVSLQFSNVSETDGGPDTAGYADISTTIAANASAVCAVITLQPEMISSDGTFEAVGSPITYSTTAADAAGDSIDEVLGCISSLASPSTDWAYVATASSPTDCVTGDALDIQFINSPQTVSFDCVPGEDVPVDITFNVSGGSSGSPDAGSNASGTGQVAVSVVIQANSTTYPDGVCAQVSLQPEQVEADGTHDVAGQAEQFETSAPDAGTTEAILGCISSLASPAPDWSYAATVSAPTDCSTGAALDVQFSTVTQTDDLDCIPGVDTPISFVFNVE